jgi:hypothetical protein
MLYRDMCNAGARKSHFPASGLRIDRRSNQAVPLQRVRYLFSDGSLGWNLFNRQVHDAHYAARVKANGGPFVSN